MDKEYAKSTRLRVQLPIEMSGQKLAAAFSARVRKQKKLI